MFNKITILFFNEINRIRQFCKYIYKYGITYIEYVLNKHIRKKSYGLNNSINVHITSFYYYYYMLIYLRFKTHTIYLEK